MRAAYVFRQPIEHWVRVKAGLSMTKSIYNKPGGYFYRFTANFSHKGEPLKFDYVVACNIRITTYRGGGGTSDDSTYSPKVMMMPTNDGAAIMLRTVRACKGQTTENGKVPKDLFPMAIWFDDVNDMTFGWGYATEDAYENKLSQLEFHKAEIYRSNYDEWQAWRKASVEGFNKVGMITTPWGMTYNEKWYSDLWHGPYDMSKRRVARNCRGYSRLKIPESIRSKIREFWPKERPRYWAIAPSRRNEYESILRKGRYENGKSLGDFDTRRFYFGEYGLTLLNGNGNISRWLESTIPPEVYPLLPRSLSTTPMIEQPADNYPRRIIYDNGRLKGLVACGGDAPVDRDLMALCGQKRTTSMWMNIRCLKIIRDGCNLPLFLIVTNTCFTRGNLGDVMRTIVCNAATLLMRILHRYSLSRFIIS